MVDDDGDTTNAALTASVGLVRCADWSDVSTYLDQRSKRAIILKNLAQQRAVSNEHYLNNLLKNIISQ